MKFKTKFKTKVNQILDTLESKLDAPSPPKRKLTRTEWVKLQLMSIGLGFVLAELYNLIKNFFRILKKLR